MGWKNKLIFGPLIGSLIDTVSDNDSNWAVNKLSKLPIIKEIYGYGYDAGFKKGFVQESKKQAFIFKRNKSQFEDVLQSLKADTQIKNEYIDDMLEKLEQYERSLNRRVWDEENKTVKTESDIRVMNVGNFLAPNSLVNPFSVIYDVYRKGKNEGKYDGQSEAKRIFTEKLRLLKEDFEKCKKDYEIQLKKLNYLGRDIEIELETHVFTADYDNK